MTEKQMFDFLVAGGLSEHGAAVLLGHFQAESGLNSRNLQNSFQIRTQRLWTMERMAILTGMEPAMVWLSGLTGAERRIFVILQNRQERASGIRKCSFLSHCMS